MSRLRTSKSRRSNESGDSDVVYLRQDAIDGVDVPVLLERQEKTLMLMNRLVDCDYLFTDWEVRVHFTQLTGLVGNLNDAVASGSTSRLVGLAIVLCWNVVLCTRGRLLRRQVS